MAFTSIKFKRDVEGRNINPEYSIEIKADGKAIWTGIHGVAYTGSETIQLDAGELNKLNDLCQKLQTITPEGNHCIEESNRSCASLEIEFNDGTKLTTYENIGRYRKDTDVPALENLTDDLVQDQLLPGTSKDAALELLYFEFQLDKLVQAERFI